MLGHQPILQIVLRKKLAMFQCPTFPGEDRDLYATLLLTPEELFRNNLRGKNTETTAIFRAGSCGIHLYPPGSRMWVVQVVRQLGSQIPCGWARLQGHADDLPLAGKVVIKSQTNHFGC